MHLHLEINHWIDFSHTQTQTQTQTHMRKGKLRTWKVGSEVHVVLASVYIGHIY